MKATGYFTTRGKDLSVKLQAGAALHITRVAAGCGETALSAATLYGERQALAVNSMRRDGETVTLPATLTAALAEEDYALREIGVYADDPDEGEILYRIYRLDESMGVTAGGRLTIRFDLEVTVSEAAEVTVAGTAAGLLTEGDLEALRGVPGGFASLDETGTVPAGQLPYTWGTDDLEAGVTPLETGKLHFVYE